MREYTVIGISSAIKGQYDGKSYDNTYLYVTYKSEKVNGTACDSLKVKSAVLAQYPVKIGDRIFALCDTYGRVVELRKI